MPNCALFRQQRPRNVRELDLPQNTVSIRRSIHRSDTGCSVGLGSVGNVNPNPLVWIATGFCLADDDLVDFAILAEIVAPSESLKELVFVAYRWIQANHIDQVLLHDSDSSKILSTRCFNFALFGLFLFRGGSLSMLQRKIRFESIGEPVSDKSKNSMDQHILICIGNFVLYGLLVVNTSAVGAATLLTVGFDVVEAKLANLSSQNICQEALVKRSEGTGVTRDGFGHT